MMHDVNVLCRQACTNASELYKRHPGGTGMEKMLENTVESLLNQR